MPQKVFFPFWVQSYCHKCLYQAMPNNWVVMVHVLATVQEDAQAVPVVALEHVRADVRAGVQVDVQDVPALALERAQEANL